MFKMWWGFARTLLSVQCIYEREFSHR